MHVSPFCKRLDVSPLVSGEIDKRGDGYAQKKTPELTLDLALRVLRSALPQPTLTKPVAMEIVEYHLHRNRIARKSHGKRWLKRHEGVKFKQLL